MKHIRTIFPAILLVVVFSTTAFADWIIFHKPAFRGKVIDAETKEPIEGAVVVAVYRTESIISGPGGGSTTVIKVKETLTDESGEFRFSSYMTFTNPNATEFPTSFIIYKPGYNNFSNSDIHPPGCISAETEENFFLAENFGKQGEVTINIGEDRGTRVAVTYGLVELPKVKTKKERLRAIPGKPMDFSPKELPNFYKIVNEEYRRFGVSEVR